MATGQKRALTIMATSETKYGWLDRAEKFQVKLAAFIRGKLTHYYDQRLKAGGSNGAWSEGRSYELRDKEPGQQRGEFVQTSVEPKVFDKLLQWAQEEGQDLGPFCSSIIYRTDNDSDAKPFFKAPAPSRAGKKPVRQTEIVIEVGRRQFTEADAHTVYMGHASWKRVTAAAAEHGLTPSEMLEHCFMKVCHPFFRNYAPAAESTVEATS